MDLVGKVIALILCFVLVIFMFMVNAQAKDARMSKGIPNEMSTFIDIVCDTGVMSDSQVKDFQLATAAYGVVCDINVTRNVSVINPDGDGGIIEGYIPVEAGTNWDQGDIIQVNVMAIEYTGAQKLMQQFFGYSPPSFNETMSGMIRK